MNNLLYERNVYGRLFRLRDDGRWYVVRENGDEDLWSLAAEAEMEMAREHKRLKDLLCCFCECKAYHEQSCHCENDE